MICIYYTEYGKGSFKKFNVSNKTKLMIIFYIPPPPNMTKTILFDETLPLLDKFRFADNIELNEWSLC